MQPRIWGWDRSSNLLFIDQPTQTGFSYDEAVDASVYLLLRNPFALKQRLHALTPAFWPPEWLFRNGTFSSGREANTQNSTSIAARVCWHFLQGFLSAFPQYNPGVRPNSTLIEPAAVNLFAERYGGIYGPVFADFFEDQNDRRRNGSISADTLEIRLGTVGIVNGLLDQLTQTVAVANFTRNNSFGIQAIDLGTYENIFSSLGSDDGCRDLVLRCRGSHSSTASAETTNHTRTDDLCASAATSCMYIANFVYDKLNRSVYDIRVSPHVSPGAAYQEYLNTDYVLSSVGAKVNFTQSSDAIVDAFKHSKYRSLSSSCLFAKLCHSW